MVGDGSFYFDVTLPASKQTIRLNIIIQTEIFDGKNGFIKALNSTEFKSCKLFETLFHITAAIHDPFVGKFSLTFGDISVLMLCFTNLVSNNSAQCLGLF